MANMSYIRFENTYRDLLDCMDNLFEDDDLSDSEIRYRKQLVALCRKLVRQAEAYSEEFVEIDTAKNNP